MKIIYFFKFKYVRHLLIATISLFVKFFVMAAKRGNLILHQKYACRCIVYRMLNQELSKKIIYHSTTNIRKRLLIPILIFCFVFKCFNIGCIGIFLNNLTSNIQ